MSKVIKQLNQIQADSHALFVKIHNYHWNIKGINFHSIHEYTEKEYDEMAEIFDAVAERALMLNEKPIVDPKVLLELTKIKTEEKDSFDAKYVIQALLADFEYLKKEFEKLSELAQDDSGTQMLADDQISALEKKIWMLKSSLA